MDFVISSNFDSMGGSFELDSFPRKAAPCLGSTFRKPACHFLEVSHFQRSTPRGVEVELSSQPERPLACRLSPGGPLPCRTSKSSGCYTHPGQLLSGTHDGLMRGRVGVRLQPALPLLLKTPKVRFRTDSAPGGAPVGTHRTVCDRDRGTLPGCWPGRSDGMELRTPLT